MINIFIGFIISIISFNLFIVSNRAVTLGSTLESLPMSLIENSVAVSSSSYVYFDKSLLEYNVTNYIDTMLKPKYKNYGLDFYYYNSEDELICFGNECSGVEITLVSKLTSFTIFKKTMYYEIQRNQLWMEPNY